MNRDQIISFVQKQMPSKRWQHTEGVRDSAVILASQYGADAVKADIAAILHDVAKYMPIEEQRDMIKHTDAPTEILQYGFQLWHAPVGAYIAEETCGITDQAILDAIKYHTSGRVGMTVLDKVICVADYIEPNRSYPGVEQIRELAKKSLDEALLAGLDSTIEFLLEKGKKVYPQTIFSRNAIIDELNEAKYKNN
ncbi:bis(5'-nucleosyl)-tetraphosphatase (symmetrical) YqeK [Longirhabdus pacifica]|uniref:bis(5'-nucleosyl)-tetraphosphatase (symmetrical) YqeK n=1 Tax=Longirhabdus pacifica TaxID=2305227 RepID=UPI001008B678|nr:bis(5'-nucleosyl)-tetraphosphatase (symmetrical) YqeK [Longirhabdus pacifica]